MQILLLPQTHLGIIQMYSRKVPIPHLLVKLLHDVGVALGCPDVVSRCKEVAGVKADSDARLVLDERDD